jgi:hypothetical protein
VDLDKIKAIKGWTKLKNISKLRGFLGLTGYYRFMPEGHQGIVKTYIQVRKPFSWRGLKEDVVRHIKECTTFQENRDEHTHPAGLLQPLPIPEHKWESISMDFITGLPTAQGKYCIFVVVDRLTKFAHFFSIAIDFNAT